MRGIRRLADQLDLSIGTVSRALNGKPDVNETTRQRVLDAAEAMGYVPNQSGRALRKGSTGIIGFMIETGAKTSVDGDTFFLSVFDGVQTVLARHQLDLVALLCSSGEDPHEYLRRVVDRGFVDGLILSATQRVDERVAFLSQRHIPFITLGRTLTDAGHPWMDLDFESMAELAVARLVESGHRRIALVCPSGGINLSYVFTEGYRQALLRRDIAFDAELVVQTPSNVAGGQAAARRILALPDVPTAVITESDVTTVGLYRGLADAGIEPGRDIAIIGRDSPLSRYLSPPLTGFNTSLSDLGIVLAESLLANMSAYSDLYPRGLVRELWPLTLIEGQSDRLAQPPAIAATRQDA